MLGTTVGSYRITGQLAAGGMGEVFAATHDMMGREAVVKVLLPEMSVKKDMVTRFFNEARAAASIHHPGIVEVFDMGYAEDGRAFIVMEKLRGETLSARLRAGPMRSAGAASLARQIAGALGAAHALGIVHRDLKPDNLFIVPDPEVGGGERAKVLDFGIAKLAGDRVGGPLTAAGAIFGTPAYMAPEQCSDAASVDHRADLYALGCILFECLCGKPPFGHGGLQLLAAHLRDPPPPPRSLNPTVPADLEGIVLRLLAKDPNARFQSCAELEASLRSYATEPPPIAGPFGTAPSAAGSGAAAAPTVPTPAPRPITTQTAASGEAQTGPSSHRRWPLFVGLAALVVGGAVTSIVLAVGGSGSSAGGGTPGLADASPGLTADAAPDQRAALALAAAERALSEGRWTDAIVAADQAGKAAINDAERARADELSQQARGEVLAEVLFGGLKKAAEENDHVEVASLFAQIAETSRFHAQAKELYEASREQAIGKDLARARRLALEGKRCRTIRSIAAKIVPDYPELETELGNFERACKKRAGTSRATEDPAVPKPEPTNKGVAKDPGSEVRELVRAGREAAKTGEFRRALRLCASALKLRRSDQDALMVCVIAACYLKNAAAARRFVAGVRSESRKTMGRQICLKNGVRLE